MRKVSYKEQSKILKIDRTESFDDYFPCRKERSCKLKIFPTGLGCLLICIIEVLWVNYPQNQILWVILTKLTEKY
ncbi:MAG: hypothetical protein WCF03_06260, partial [Nitrososphaeraceae archaeon]